MRAARATGGLLSLLVLVTGCGGGGAERPRSAPSSPRTITVTPVPLPRGVHLSFVQQRFDEGTRRAQVRVVNGTEHALQVRRVGVDWAGFPLRMHPAAYAVPGRQTVDLRYLLPAADCSPEVVDAPMVGVVETRARTLRRPMAAEGRRFLLRLWRTECNGRRVDRAVDLGYGARWTTQGRGQDAVLRGSLVLTRRGGAAPVTVDQVQGSVLFDLALAGTTAERTLAETERRQEVPLEVSAGRCDEHARSQSTQSFLFRTWVRLGDDEPVAVAREPSRRLQSRLLDFLDFACGGLTSH